MLNTKLLGSVSAAPAEYVEDVFSTYLYSGNGSTQTINNGIDLSTEGGLVWTKGRGNFSENHGLVDTVRGSNKYLASNNTDAEGTGTQLTGFTSTGYTLGAVNGWEGNTNGRTYASWTFRKAPKFFDVVTYTGNGTSGRTVAHNLGSAPGMMFVKKTSGGSNWAVYHRSEGSTKYLILNDTAASQSSIRYWNNTSPTSTEFTLGDSLVTNESGSTYVAYLFAHNAGGFGAAGTDNVISCGSYTGNGSSTGPEINLGYEPQFVMIKNATTGGELYDWYMFDNMREITTTNARQLKANLSDAESSSLLRIGLTSTGFKLTTNIDVLNGSGSNYIYMAIRRPMKPPTTGTEVFQPATRTGNGTDTTITSTISPVDAIFIRDRGNSTGYSYMFFDRLRGPLKLLYTDNTQSENNTSGTVTGFDVQNGYTLGGDSSYYGTNYSGLNIVDARFKRATGFFDVVCYTGNGTALTVNHNLGVAPQIIIAKRRNSTSNWAVTVGGNIGYNLNTTNQAAFAGGGVNVAGASSTTFQADYLQDYAGNSFNISGATYVAYLFATVAGVSKVGEYIGTGTTQTINCGFTAGARFVLIKRTDSTGDWYVWDTARGIVSGNDPHLSLNTTAAEVTSNDSVDPDSSGFVVNQLSATNINVSSATYIFLAIA